MARLKIGSKKTKRVRVDLSTSAAKSLRSLQEGKIRTKHMRVGRSKLVVGKPNVAVWMHWLPLELRVAGISIAGFLLESSSKDLV